MINNTIKNNLNNCIDGLQGLVEASKALEKVAVNDYTARMTGQYVGIYAKTAESINYVIDRLIHVQNIIVNITIGDHGDLEELKERALAGEELGDLNDVISNLVEKPRLIEQ